MIITISDLIDGLNDILSDTSALWDYVSLIDENGSEGYLNDLTKIENNIANLEKKMKEFKTDLKELIE